MGKYEEEILLSTPNNQASPTDIPVTRSTREKRKREIDRGIRGYTILLVRIADETAAAAFAINNSWGSPDNEFTKNRKQGKPVENGFFRIRKIRETIGEEGSFSRLFHQSQRRLFLNFFNLHPD